jgi:hypothetical protein
LCEREINWYHIDSRTSTTSGCQTGWLSSCCLIDSVVVTHSNSLILSTILDTISSESSFDNWSHFWSHFDDRIASLVSKSGAFTSHITQSVKRVLNLGSKIVSSFGERSQERMICLFFSTIELKIPKNTSWVLSFHAKNWISSIIKTSTLSNCLTYHVSLFFLTASIKWSINFVHGRYNTTFLGSLSIIWFAVACNKCVFHKPAFQCIKNGLYWVPGVFEIAFRIEVANSLCEPTTKLSNWYFDSKITQNIFVMWWYRSGFLSFQTHTFLSITATDFFCNNEGLVWDNCGSTT